jgi:cytochrome c oxidase subunit 3
MTHDPIQDREGGPVHGSGEGGKLGLWLFILSEIMLFGGFLACYATIRWGSSACALGSPAWPKPGYTGGLLLAAANTVVLITSSFTMARACLFARAHDARYRANLLATIILGCAFLLIKGFEYHLKIHHGYFPGSEWMHANPGVTIFISFYFVMTGLHGLHVLAGIVWNALLYKAEATSKLEYAGLYWHFVDVVWVLLFPLFYLI